MTELTVVQPIEGDMPLDQAAHDTAVAEGASAVLANDAKEAASEAKGAAEAALSAANANIESTGTAIEAADVAQESAATAQVSAEMVHEALLAQTAAISALVEEIQMSRKQSAPQKPSRRTRDRVPGASSSGPRLVRR